MYSCPFPYTFLCIKFLKQKNVKVRLKLPTIKHASMTFIINIALKGQVQPFLFYLFRPKWWKVIQINVKVRLKWPVIKHASMTLLINIELKGQTQPLLFYLYEPKWWKVRSERLTGNFIMYSVNLIERIQSRILNKLLFCTFEGLGKSGSYTLKLSKQICFS